MDFYLYSLSCLDALIESRSNLHFRASRLWHLSLSSASTIVFLASLITSLHAFTQESLPTKLISRKINSTPFLLLKSTTVLPPDALSFDFILPNILSQLEQPRVNRALQTAPANPSSLSLLVLTLTHGCWHYPLRQSEISSYLKCTCRLLSIAISKIIKICLSLQY